MQTLQYGYLEAFVDELRSKGRYTFTLSELRTKYELSDEALKKALQRLTKKKEAARIRKEFYVVVPPEYRSRGVLPASLFVADLMKFLQKNYYTGLLSAASFYGAAHQQPQEFYIITTKPTLRPIKSNKLKINFYYKKEWLGEDVKERKMETGYLKVSSPELTALDLVAYFDRVGGLNRVATILNELAEGLNNEKLAQTASRYGQIATIQRLGFLLDEVLGRRELVNNMAEYLKTVNHFPVLLRPQKAKPETMVTGNNWKVVANAEIEVDL
jgi:predicted transcriptional regulator of viral defense system